MRHHQVTRTIQLDQKFETAEKKNEPKKVCCLVLSHVFKVDYFDYNRLELHEPWCTMSHIPLFSLEVLISS